MRNASDDNILRFASQHIWRWLAITATLTAVYYVFQLLALIARFGEMPNYINTYDWFHNVRVIIHSTPSAKDTLLIIKDEWLLEVGFMSYDYGMGISIWSLFIAPAKVAMVFILNGLLAINILLFKTRQPACPAKLNTNLKVASGTGAALVAITSLTMSWVVCCSTPTWVVGLSMLGLGVTTALYLEPIGMWLTVTGVSMLILVTSIQTRLIAARKPEYILAAQLR